MEALRTALEAIRVDGGRFVMKASTCSSGEVAWP